MHQVTNMIRIIPGHLRNQLYAPMKNGSRKVGEISFHSIIRENNIGESMMRYQNHIIDLAKQENL
jgi:hypothetical protein